MRDSAHRLGEFCVGAITVVGVLWVADLPLHLGIPLIAEHVVLVIAGLAVAAGFLLRPYGKIAGGLEILLALFAMGCWAWAAFNYTDWLLNAADRTPGKWLPGVLGLALLLEAVRRNCGTAIAVLIGVIGLYGFVGHWLPGVLEAAYTEPRRMVIYLYADPNGVPGLVLRVASSIVLAFIVFSKTLEIGGAGKFFDDLSMGLLGRYRGGPAKVAVVSSSLFGIVSGSSVANVVSSGIVTIPLMKRHGFKGTYAAAVEAVASNAGQFTPPVMGTAAFLIAEFLEIPYSDVVLAAIIPAAIFYVVLLVQIDCHAAREGLHGLARNALPSVGRTVARGWTVIIPIVVLVYFMFHLGYDAAKAALIAAALMLILGLARERRMPSPGLARDVSVGAGREMVQILLVSAAAGIVVGILNITGLSFTVTLLLTHAAQNAGVVVMLLLTAGIALVLGMGMPTAAVYVLLSVILGPTLVKMGLEPLPAHLFIFYFGLLSMLTPPVAMASYAAASLADSDLWRTSLVALKLGAASYLLPFLFALNPALVGQGTAAEVALAAASALVAGAMLAFAAEGSIGVRRIGALARCLLASGALVVGGATIWLGRSSPAAFGVLLAGVALAVTIRILAKESAPHGSRR